MISNGLCVSCSGTSELAEQILEGSIRVVVATARPARAGILLQQAESGVTEGPLPERWTRWNDGYHAVAKVEFIHVPQTLSRNEPPAEANRGAGSKTPNPVSQ